MTSEAEHATVFSLEYSGSANMAVSCFVASHRYKSEVDSAPVG